MNTAEFFWTDAEGIHTGTATATANETNLVTADLTGVPNERTITVVLRGVRDASHMSDMSVKMGVLQGDVNATGTVNAGDALIVRNNSGLTVDGSRFKSDVNADGFINSGDATIVRDKSGIALP